DGWVDKYLGAIKKPADAIARVREVEPEWTTERRFEKFAPIVRFPAPAIVYRAPKTTSPDIPALRLAASILAGGESSRLYMALVRNQQIAQEATLDMTLNTEGGRMALIGIGAEKGTAQSRGA